LYVHVAVEREKKRNDKQGELHPWSRKSATQSRRKPLRAAGKRVHLAREGYVGGNPTQLASEAAA